MRINNGINRASRIYEREDEPACCFLKYPAMYLYILLKEISRGIPWFKRKKKANAVYLEFRFFLSIIYSRSHISSRLILIIGFLFF